MKSTQLFTKTRKDAPSDEAAKNAQLLIRAGFINKEMAGVYNYLPLGLRVLENIIQIIREEMNSIGGQEVFLSALQPKKNWEASGRWLDEAVDVWFKTRMHDGSNGFHSGQELGLGNTHEEALTAVMRDHIHSYKDLPAYPYQFQTKFRNELRSKSGIMRCREFIMKDLYSFSRDQKQHDEFYETVKKSYIKIFERLGLGDTTYLTFASGGSFSRFSHEFQTITDIGEDTIYVSEEKRIAINKEVYSDDVLKELGLKKEQLEEKQAVEVGNIFTLGTKFSEALNLSFTDEDGSVKPVIMGSYGIGPGRVMGTIAEHFSDEKGLVWSENIAPFTVYLATVGTDTAVIEAADKLYSMLTREKIKVLYDERDVRAGEKFADADLMGIPHRIVVSPKTLDSGKYEYKRRQGQNTKLLDIQAILENLNQRQTSLGSKGE